MSGEGVGAAATLAVAGELPIATDGNEAVASLMPEDLFDGGWPNRPMHPWLQRPIEPGDLAAIKVVRGTSLSQPPSGCLLEQAHRPALLS
jgi:hypothetical protein